MSSDESTVTAEGAAGRARRGMRLVALLAAVVAIAAVAGFLGHDRRQIVDGATAIHERRAARLASEVAQALAAAGAAIARLESVAATGGAGGDMPARLRAVLAEQAPLLSALPLPLRLWAVDAQGAVIAHAAVPERPGALPPPPGEGWVVQDPVGPAGERRLPLWRRAAPQTPALTGFVVEIDLPSLRRRFDRSRATAGGTAALFRLERDGASTLLARSPHHDDEVGRRVRGPLAAQATKASSGHFDAVTQLDGRHRLIAFVRVAADGDPLVVAYGAAVDELLAPWWSRLPWAVSALLLVLGAIGFGAQRLDRALAGYARQQQALRRSESQFRALADNLPDVVLRLDREGRYQYANAAVREATGQGPEAFVGRTAAELGMEARSVDAWATSLQRLFDSGVAERIEFSLPGPQGERWWESKVVLEPRPPGGEPTALVISRDITERRVAAEALRASEQRLRESQQLARIGHWEFDLRSGALAWSDEIFRIFEIEPGRFSASYEGFLAAIHPDDRDAVDAAFRRSVAERAPYAIGHRLRFGDGRVKHVHEQGYTQYDDGGTPLRTLGTVQDVTERVLAEQALRASEASHREMFEANPHPMWVYDLQTLAFLAVNDAALRQYGWSREEFLHMSIRDIRPAEDLPRLLANVAAVQPGIDDAGTWRHRTRDGRLLEVEITSHTLRFEGRDAELVLAHDVTRRNQTERALRDREERLRLAMEAANQGLYDLDLRSGDAVVSPEYARMLGWDPATFRETNAAWRDRLHPDDREAVDRIFDDYLSGRRPDYRVEFRQRMRDGGWKWILSVGRIQERDAEGRPLRLLGTHTDLDAIKAAQAEQAAATRRFETLFRAAPEAMAVKELEGGRLLQVNAAFCELLGRPADALLGRTAAELALWPDARPGDDPRSRLAAGLPVKGLEAVARRGDGQRLEVLLSAERIELDGRDRVLLLLHDITPRKRLEAALRASESRLAHLLARAPTVIYTARAEGDFAATYYSPNLPGMLGWRPEQFLQDGAFWIDHLHPDDLAGVLDAMNALEHQDELVLEYRFRHADGGWRWMRDQISVQRGADGRAVELVGSWIDITERREAEDEVRRLAAELEQRVRERTTQLALSEARYRTIFETVPVSIGEEDWSGVQRLLRGLRASGVDDGPGYFAARPDFVQDCLRAVTVRRLNRKAIDLHDARGHEGEMTGLQSFYPRPDDLSQFVGELEAMWSGQRLYSAKKSLPSVTGRPLSLMLTMSLPGLDDDDGTALVCLVDITEIDRLNAELDRSVARLRDVNRELETFTYSVSHDLKAPLRGIDGYSRLLLADHAERLDDEARQFLGHIRQATQHMGVLIDDLLAYSRLERRDVVLTSVPLAPLVNAVLGGWRSELEACGAEIAVDLPPGLAVRADAHGLTMALRNLVDNALKFSRDRGPPRIEVSATRAEDGVRLAVRDNGVGFDMKFHDRIFAIFQRLHRAEEYPGTGVGLAIVRKAMDRMGGRVWAESRPGEGATFTLELPEAP